MSQSVRVEVLHPGTTDRFEYWQDRAGTVRLFRRPGDAWQATLRGHLVTEREEIEDNVLLVGARPLRSDNLETLVALLAMQENVHALLDGSRAWGRGDDARLLEPQADAPRTSPDEIAE